MAAWAPWTTARARKIKLVLSGKVETVDVVVVTVLVVADVDVDVVLL